MQAYKLSALLRIVKQLDPRVLSEIATVPSNLWRDEEDRVIVNV